MSSLLNARGPTPDRYAKLGALLIDTALALKEGGVDLSDIHSFWLGQPPEFLSETIQGWCARRPMGYAGDFSVIDRLYLRSVSRLPEFVEWDRWCHWQDAAAAVRNRKEYFKKTIEDLEERTPHMNFRVLNLGSGPAREVAEYCRDHPDSRVRFYCVDQDARAIEYASALTRSMRDRVEFRQENVLRLRSEEKFDLIWSAGLFDYFSDRLFVYSLRRLRSMLQLGGRMVIGNFSNDNRTEAYMQLIAFWTLNQRSPERLLELGAKAGFPSENCSIFSEPTNVNLFFHYESR